MQAPLFISRRLSLKRDADGRHRSPAVVIAVAGIALSVAVMMITLAIVPGFRNKVTHKVMGFESQVTLTPVRPDGYENVTAVPAVCPPRFVEMIKSRYPEAEVGLAVKLPGILKTDDQFAGLVFNTVDGPDALDFLEQNIVEGAMPDYAADSTLYHIVISQATARALEVGPGDRIDGYFFHDDNLRARRFTIAAIYNSRFNDFDRLIAFMSMPAAQRLLQLDADRGTEIRIRRLPDDLVGEACADIARIAGTAFADGVLPDYVEATDVYSQNPMYFNWLDLLDTNVAVILWLMSCVGAVTLISCLFIMILERVRLIGTLKSIGATNAQVIRIFMLMAERVVIRGILIGDAIAVTFILLQRKYALLSLNPDAYYLDTVPVEFNWTGFILLNIAAALLAFAIMLIPAITISRISPARVVRFE